MKLYYIFSAVILGIQFIEMFQAIIHTVFTALHYKPRETGYPPRTAVISPCKGLDNTFERNIASLFQMNYPHYEIHFVVESESDPAYEKLHILIERYLKEGRAAKATVHVAGLAATNSQKVHNLRYAITQLPDDIEVFIFVDSDACFPPHFITSMVRPLKKEFVGAATGYRWFVPTDKRLSSRTLSAINAFFASLLGPHPWNSAWGGAMAIHKETFIEAGLPEIWKTTLSDDYSLTMAVRTLKRRVWFVPACFIASYEQVNWQQLVTFARRQFIITRRYMPLLWLFAVGGIGHYVLGFWMGAAVTAQQLLAGSEQWFYAALMPMVLLVLSILKAAVRQFLIRKILPADRKPLLIPGLIDIFCQPFLALFTWILLLSTAGSRTVVWRGVRYIILNDKLQIVKMPD